MCNFSLYGTPIISYICSFVKGIVDAIENDS